MKGKIREQEIMTLLRDAGELSVLEMAKRLQEEPDWKYVRFGWVSKSTVELWTVGQQHRFREL